MIYEKSTGYANDMQTRETQVRKYIIEFSLYFVANFES